MHIPRPGRSWGARLALPILLAGAAALLAWSYPVVGAARGQQTCRPESWADWRSAMQESCVAPAYVCENLTTERVAKDPAVAADARRAEEAGEPSPLAGIDALVGHIRSVYGCDGAKPAPDPHAAPERQLPPGHPPTGGPHGGAPGPVLNLSFQPPASLEI